jgi:plasmid replication initiation protein
MKKRKQLDLFQTITASLTPIKSNTDMMTRSLVDLSRHGKKLSIIHDDKKGARIEIKADEEYGIATIYDMDILLFLSSKIMDKENRGDKHSRYISFSGYEYFYFTNKEKGSKAIQALENSLDRLHHTNVRTTIQRKNMKTKKTHSFYWLSEWEKEEDRSGRAIGYTAVLPDWLYQGIIDKETLLTLDDDYFEIDGGLTRFIYLLCRKSCGKNMNRVWSESFESIYKKTAMTSPIHTFTHSLRKIISKQSVNGYYLEENTDKRLTITRIRKTLHPKKDEAS